MTRRETSACLLPMVLALAGCQPVPSAAPAATAPAEELAAHYRANAAGAIEGQVLWTGEVPVVKPFTALALASVFLKEKVPRENPNAPAIDPEGRGVGSAAVFLRGVAPEVSRPWDLPPVQVALEDDRFDVRQGARVGRYGFVRRGESVEMVSRQGVPQMLRATGSAYFTLAFPEPDRPLTRQLRRHGVVELTNAVNFCWMRAYLFVDDHPYYTRTDPSGRFVLRDVPPGRYEAVCWMPNWHESQRDLDPELGVVVRLFFQPPVEKVRTVTVETGRTLGVRFEMKTADFVGNPASAGTR